MTFWSCKDTYFDVAHIQIFPKFTHLAILYIVSSSFNKNALSFCYVPGTVLESEDKTVIK